MDKYKVNGNDPESVKTASLSDVTLSDNQSKAPLAEREESFIETTPCCQNSIVRLTVALICGILFGICFQKGRG